ncbi:MAG: hypothetical protein ACFB0F_16355 [Neomegalonema sp.]
MTLHRTKQDRTADFRIPSDAEMRQAMLAARQDRAEAMRAFFKGWFRTAPATQAAPRDFADARA